MGGAQELSEQEMQAIVLGAIEKSPVSPAELEANPPPPLTPEQTRIAVERLLDAGKVELSSSFDLQVASGAPSPGQPQFMECPTCAAKPGAPTLCPSCLHNRRVIGELEKPHKTGRVANGAPSPGMAQVRAARSEAERRNASLMRRVRNVLANVWEAAKANELEKADYYVTNLLLIFNEEGWRREGLELVWRKGLPPPEEKRVAIRLADGRWTVWDRETEPQAHIGSLLLGWASAFITHWSPIPEPHLKDRARWDELVELCRGC